MAQKLLNFWLICVILGDICFCYCWSSIGLDVFTPSSENSQLKKKGHSQNTGNKYVRRVLVQKSKVSWATPLSRLYVSLAVLAGKVFGHSCTGPCFSDKILDCKTVRIFAYSSTREQSSKRSGARLKKASATGQWREGVWLLLRYTKPILRKKPTILTV